MNKRILLKIVFLIIFILVFFIIITIAKKVYKENAINNLENNITSESISNSINLEKEKELYNIICINDDEKIIAKVDDEYITDKDRKIFQYFHQNIEKNEMLNEIIDRKIILNEAKSENIQYSLENEKYIESIIKEYKKNSNELLSIGVTNLDMYTSIIRNNLNESAIVSEFKNQITKKIQDGAFIIDINEINEKYQEYNNLKEKIKETENIEFINQMLFIREEILEMYIKSLKERHVVEVYEN